MGATVAVAVIVWLLVPITNRDKTRLSSLGSGANSGTQGITGSGIGQSSNSTAAQAGTTGAGTTAASGGGVVGAGTAGAAKLTGGAGQAAGGAVRAGCPAGGDQGVSASQIKIAISLVNIVGPAGNSTFGLPSVSEQQSDYQEVVDSINDSGGVACRKLVPEFYTANPADNSDLQQKCLGIIQSQPFFVIDAGGFSASTIENCFPENHLPFATSVGITDSQINQFYPYFFGTYDSDTLYRNTVMALNGRGFFSPANGFSKLGFIYGDCFHEIIPEILGWLHQVGLSSSQIVPYDVSCPQGFANPSDLEQAILKFQQNGVTHVTTAEFVANFANFTKIAQQQGFHPKYGIADEGEVAITSGTLAPDYNNVANAIAITNYRYGEEHTSGIAPNPGTTKCNAIYQSHGRPSVYQQPVAFNGAVCSQLWMVAAAIDHAPVLQRSALATGLQTAKSVDFSFPYGPNDFSGPRTTTGGQFWRPDQFFTSCHCWRTIDPAFHPSF
jgi:hypothetical protein